MRRLSLGIFATVVFMSGSATALPNLVDKYLVFDVEGSATADGQSLEPGNIFNRTAIISVSSGSQLVLFGESGKVLVKGSFVGVIKNNDPDQSLTTPSQPSMVSGTFWQRILLAAIQVSQSRGQSPSSGNGWSIRIDVSGTKCVRLELTEPLQIEVSPSFNNRHVTIRDVDEDKQISLILKSPETDWPADLSISIGESYRATIDGTGITSTFSFAAINDGKTTLDENTLQQMSDRQCNDQILNFAGTLPAKVIITEDK